MKKSNKLSLTLTKTLILVFTSSILFSCGSSSKTTPTSPPPDKEKKNKPNIVLILTDDMRWDLMSIVNHPYLKTPALDKLANNGVLFKNGFIPFAVCSPSRAALLSGREPHQASTPGIFWRNNSFLETQTTFPKILHDNGYQTSYIGKWHLGDGKNPKPGFDHWESFDAMGSFWDTTLWINGNKKKFEGFSDDILAERTVKYIKQTAGTSKPFFVMVGFKEPHIPFDHPTRFNSAFESTIIPKPDSFNEDFSVSGRENISWLDIKTMPYGIPHFGSWDKYIKSHYRGVLGLDSAVDKIMTALEESGELDNTLFIYTSDNGYTLGEHGYTEKHVTYEEPIHVPMLVSYPNKITAGIQRKELVSSVDIAPTILDYAGIDIPNYMSGLSWKPLLEANENESPAWRDKLFFWLVAIHKTIRTTDYKLIKSLKTSGHYELYDLKKDPKELINVYNDASYASVKDSMLAKLTEEAERIGWTRRVNSNIKGLYTSQLMPKDTAIALIEELSKKNIGQEILSTLEGKIQWSTKKAVKRAFQFDSTDKTKHSILIAIPFERVTEWDPFVSMGLSGNNQTFLYSKGKKIWDSKATVAFNICNPPLHEKFDYAYMLMDMSSEIQNVKISLGHPSGSIILPLEK